MSREETISISPCPLCGQSHAYRAIVESATVLFTFKGKQAPQPVQFTRLFVCPTKRTNFQATIEIAQQSGEMIEGITITNVQQR